MNNMKHTFNKKISPTIYSIGDTFRLNPTNELYVLTLVGDNNIQLTNMNTGNRFSLIHKCQDVFAITKEEFDRISNYREDSLIKIAQLNINTVEVDKDGWFQVSG